MSKTALLATAALLLPMASHAQAPRDDAAASDGTWALGVAVMPERKPYRDFDNKTRVWPLLTFENRWVRVFGPGVEFKLGRSGPLSYGLTVGYAGDGYKASDSPVLAGMDKRRSGIWVGGRLGLQAGWASFTADWTADAANHSQGQRLRLGAERRFQFGEVGLTPRLTATWLDSSYVDYYYGVKAGEATATRAAYAPGSTVNTEFGVRMDYRLAPQQVLFADVGVVALGNAIKRSPLVDRSTVPELRLGYLYRF
jgi:outer membrane protein